MKRHKMSKKGFEISSMLGWILGILAVFIILFIVLGPNQILKMARDAAFSLGAGVPGGEPPGAIPAEEIPEELAQYFDTLTAIINEETKQTSRERCLIPLENIPAPENNYFIAFSPGYAKIMKKVKEDSYSTPKLEQLEGFEPCVVSYWGAKNFYDNWLDGTINSPDPAKPEYYQVDSAKDIKLESQTKIITPNEPPGGPPRGYEISNEDGKRFLYKADSTHFCFISFNNDDWSDCVLNTGTSSPKGLHEQCIASLPFFVPICKGVSVPINGFKSKCDNICNKRNKQCIRGIDDGGSMEACNFKFGFEGNDDYCICSSDSENIIPLNYRTDNNKPSCTDICTKGRKTCIKGVDDSLTNLQYKICEDQFGFEGIDDYCVCSSGTVNEVPLPYDHPPTCNEICTKGGKTCMVAIDDGKPKECDNNDIRFEGQDDFCVCGEASEKVSYNPPSNQRRTCDSICNDAGISTCVMAIDDNKDIKKCDDTNVQFEKNENDGYCFCGGESIWYPPGQQSSKKTCDFICRGQGLECIIGKDDYDEDPNDNQNCYTDQFGFESKPDDYCICGPPSEKIVPLPYPGEDPKCSEVCGRKSLSCAKGVQNNADKPSPSCDKDVEFDQDDDFCVCGGEDPINVIPLNYRDDNNEPSCTDICVKNEMICGGGVHNDPDINDAIYPINKACIDTFKFEQRNDYCVCSSDFENVIPVPS